MGEEVSGNLISKILGEMKSHFNDKSEDGSDNDSGPEETVHKVEPENGKETSDDSIKEDDLSSTDAEEQPRGGLNSFRKPERVTRKGRRSTVRQVNVGVKRSTRRRSKDCGKSVLQSAIARKVKSYNETSKPQRLTRQLKPTQKILDNIASAAALKHDKKKEKGSKAKFKDDSDEETLASMFSERIGKGMKCNKKLKTENVKETKDLVEFKCRRSDRFNSSSNNSLEESNDVNESEEKISDAENEDDQPLVEKKEAEDTVEKESIIASRLCLCTAETNIFGIVDGNEDLFCMAMDSFGDKTIGCSNTVNLQKTPMIRTSTKIPYTALCNLHYKRMLRHNCCPTCGLFCTQGRFVLCTKKHYYHKDCHQTISNTNVCPHCGDPNPPYDVEVSMTTPEPPLFSTTQKSRKEFDDYGRVNGETEQECPSPPIIPVDDLRLCNGVSAKDCDAADVKNLLSCIKAGDCEKLMSLIAEESDLLHQLIPYDGESGTILHYACKHGVLSVLHALKITEMDLDILDGEQNTALMTAVIHFQNEAVRYLTRAGASITTKGMDGMTALHLAAKCGNLEATKILFGSSSHIKNYINFADDGGWTPLVWACHHIHDQIVKYLLCEGADPLLMDVEQNVALHWAAFGGSSKTVELILNFGGKVNVLNSHGDTPLHIAARQDNYNCVLILLARGSKIDAINKLQELPIDCCPENSKTYEVISLNQHLQSMINSTNKQLIYLSNDISKGKETNSIPCVNEIDDENVPENYVYITKNCITSDISIDMKITNLKSCTCEDRCSTALCSCGLLSSQCWYDQGRLTLDFNYDDPPVIFECNQVCSCCTSSCNNRIVQRGALQKFQLFRTNSKGWGVRSSKLIPCGTFVSEYIGELITDVEADKREDDSYLFDLDNRDLNTYCIDAKYYGNFTRFINHSCNPNLVPVRVFIDHQDQKFPRIALFAKRDISIYEELSFDYGDKFWLIKYKDFTCDCNSANCKYSKDAIEETIKKYCSKVTTGDVP